MEYSFIKRTIGKNGKPYYYESLSEEKDVKDVYWYRTDESMYRFLADKFLQTAVEVRRDEKGDIEFMSYVYKKELLFKDGKSGIQVRVHNLREKQSQPIELTPKQVKNLNLSKTIAYISFGILALVILLIAII